MRIELMGPSGSGKTTILDSIQSLWADKIILPNTLQLFLNRTALHEALKTINPLFERDTQLSREYLPYALGAIAQSGMSFEQKFTVIEAVRQCILHYIYADLTGKSGETVLHDELFLHRGLSFLFATENFEEAARLYYEKTPVPDVAVILRAPATVIMERAKQRGLKLNWSKGLNSEGEKQAVLKNLAICNIAAKTLAARGVDVRILDTDRPLEESASELNEIIREFARGRDADGDGPDYLERLKSRTIQSGKSFRKKTGRHYPVTQDVAYCAFSTPNFTVHRHESQRDAPARFERFGLNDRTLSGKRVLDLGSNIGAMLFQATNHGIAEGLGVEYDFEKVRIAREIAQLSNLGQLTFRQGDIDSLKAEELGSFDVTFALAIEGHVLDQERLYKLLSAVTVETLYFEGNGSCDVKTAMDMLREAGFRDVKYLGVCSDDVVPHNNCRPLIRAVK